VLLTWVERLLRDRDERVRREREIAARLLAMETVTFGE
jgi:hypothetical protein